MPSSVLPVHAPEMKANSVILDKKRKKKKKEIIGTCCVLGSSTAPLGMRTRAALTGVAQEPLAAAGRQILW